MRKLFLLAIFLISIFLSYKYFLRQKTDQGQKMGVYTKLTPSAIEKVQENLLVKKSSSIFVPYWNLSFDTLKVQGYDRLIYFAISPTKDGISKVDDGFKNIDKFLTTVPTGKKKYLTLRMIDDDVNNYILQNPDSQNKIIQETIDIIRNNSFDGIVLNLELTNYINPDIPEQIDNFVQSFYSASKKYYIPFSITIYGDTFYRKRPFDLKFLVDNSDEIIVMAYDFHKSGGEPGPNFPFIDRASYGYDFKRMIEDFSKTIPKEKLTVVFGMFGYDWSVDDNKKPIKSAEALTLIEIRNKFLSGSCPWENCLIKSDESSKETEIDYVISQVKDYYGYLYYHIVWFESEDSAKTKADYLMKQGIGSVGYWAYGYF